MWHYTISVVSNLKIPNFEPSEKLNSKLGSPLKTEPWTSKKTEPNMEPYYCKRWFSSVQTETRTSGFSLKNEPWTTITRVCFLYMKT